MSEYDFQLGCKHTDTDYLYLDETEYKDQKMFCLGVDSTHRVDETEVWLDKEAISALYVKLESILDTWDKGG